MPMLPTAWVSGTETKPEHSPNILLLLSHVPAFDLPSHLEKLSLDSNTPEEVS